MEKEVFNHIVRVLRDYPNIDKYVREREEELMHPWQEPDNNIGGGRSNVPTNLPEVMAITISDDRRLSNLERNKKIVTRCLENSDSQTVTIIHELYIKQHPTLTLQGVADKVHLSVSAVKQRRTRFFEDMRLLLGW
ncbi:transcriptional regulator [Schleiferilactobacillus harbinensis]|uniref:Transcriptional regulator n=1 Tax=Schleiferilactobacillus harbinensis TaxID=304207 RepID=A0A5P8M4S3_9LACO|nr:transcriptional regulator [Schleiferilactobacillus harbinensis]QFR23101.1 transcriptional regulator [Schleiferilactobacillus harbinensis]